MIKYKRISIRCDTFNMHKRLNNCVQVSKQSLIDFTSLSISLARHDQVVPVSNVNSQSLAVSHSRYAILSYLSHDKVTELYKLYSVITVIGYIKVNNYFNEVM